MKTVFDYIKIIKNFKLILKTSFLLKTNNVIIR